MIDGHEALQWRHNDHDSVIIPFIHRIKWIISLQKLYKISYEISYEIPLHDEFPRNFVGMTMGNFIWMSLQLRRTITINDVHPMKSYMRTLFLTNTILAVIHVSYITYENSLYILMLFGQTAAELEHMGHNLSPCVYVGVIEKIMGDFYWL